MPKTTTVRLTEKQLKQGKIGYHGIKREIATLTKELKSGTLDRKRLESGLRKLATHHRNIPAHPCD